MKEYNILIYSMISLFVMLSCKKDPEKIEKVFFMKSIEQIKVSDNYRWIVVLPGVGCDGCIQEGESFMEQNIENQKILFVLTKISSLKILQQKINIRLDKYSNIYIDRGKIFDIPSNNTIYPCVIEVDRGKYLQHSFQSPKTEAFHKLKQQINSL